MHIDVITDNIKSISSENIIKGVNELSRTLNISYKINNDEWETFNFEYAYDANYQFSNIYKDKFYEWNFNYLENDIRICVHDDSLHFYLLKRNKPITGTPNNIK